MPQLLARFTPLPIEEVKSGMQIKPNHIYLIPPGQLMTIEKGGFKLGPRELDKLPINVFMESAAQCYGQQAVGIIFSGTGLDGTKGAASIRKQGGLVIVQSPTTAEFTSMPENVISRGLGHSILASEAMWPAIQKYTGDPGQFENEFNNSRLLTDENLLDSLNIGYAELFEFLERIYDIDFSRYKITSVSRRIQRRMEQLSVKNAVDYLKYLEKNKVEADALYRDLLIGVTEFFRDSKVYDLLAERVIEPVFSSEKPPPQFRIWVAGCATGEEAYSMAILTDELAHKHDYQGQINIFATDMHKGSVQRAGQGIYTQEEVANLSKNRLDRYFNFAGEGIFRVKANIRQRVVFATHNLLVDPPFIRMDLVSCRNVLIYLKADAQDSVLRCFHYALRPKGHLLLGASESLGELESAFQTVSTRGKIFCKQDALLHGKRPPQLYIRAEDRPFSPNPAAQAKSSSISIERNLLDAYDRVLQRYAPAGVLINRDREVRHYFGAAADYCHPTEGRADRDFLSMLEGDLKLAVSTAFHRVISKKQPFRAEGISCTTRHGNEVVDISIIPYLDEGRDLGLLLVTFEPRAKADQATEDNAASQDSPSAPKDFQADQETRTRILMLEDELRSTKENLQATVEELQTSNEELQAINEEVQVSNEELQSTNEELYSMNADLYTVNADLEHKNQQLIELNNDHEHLLANTEDGILYLDSELRIKRFNPAISFAFNLRPQDVGRPIEEIAYNLGNQHELQSELRNVLETGHRIKNESITAEGISYLRRLTPFLAADKSIAGVILTFTDITESNLLRSRLTRAMQTAGMAWWEWDLESDQLNIFAGGKCVLGYDCDHPGGNANYWLKKVHPDDLERVQKSLQKCTGGEADEWICEHRYLNAEGVYEWVLETGLVVRRDASGRCLAMTGTTMNIHNRKILELDLIEAKEAAEAALKAKASFLSTMSHEIRTPLNGICGMAELLSDELQDDSCADSLDTIISSANALQELINSILDYSKAEAGRLELIPKKYKLAATVKETLEVLNARIKEKHLHVSTENQLGDAYHTFDAIRLKQVLLNLVGNAVKFTPDQGKISIKVSRLDQGHIQFIVADNGIGIDPEFQKALFEPFTQEDGSNTRKYGGTGLGLSIAKQIIELMGGQIAVDSEYGSGTRFIFTIQADPADEPEEAAEVKPFKSPNAGRLALVVDDDAANRVVMNKMLERLNFKADTARSGDQALELLCDKPYDIIFMDLQMPGESGYVVTKKIRNGQPNATHKNTPIIAFTADASAEALERVDQGDFDDILVKPVSMQSIRRLLNKMQG